MPATVLPGRIGQFQLTPARQQDKPAGWAAERIYVNPAGSRVTVALSPIVSTGETYLKSPDVRDFNIPAAGTIRLRAGTTTQKNGSNEHHASWIVVHGREFTSMLRARIFQVWRAGMLGKAGPTGMVMVTTDAPEVLDQFVAEAVPVMRDMFSTRAAGVTRAE